MTQVSKRILASKLKEKVDQTFWETVVKIKKKNEANLFFSDLFTKAERVNFVKRLSIAVLLYKNYEWRHICDLLKVSPSTIGKVAAKMGNSGFKILFEKIEKDEEWRQFWVDLGKLYLTITHPEKVGRLGSEGIKKVYFTPEKKSLL